MTDFNQILIVSLIAGAINGGLQMQSHYWLRPKRLHPVVYYTIGSVGCLIAWGATVWFLGGPLWVIFSALVVWGVTGAWDLAVYRVEAIAAQRRRAKIQKELEGNDYTGRDI